MRHLAADEPDPRWLLRDDVVRGLRALATTGLPYDVLLAHDRLPVAVELAALVPELPLVLDHLGKPAIAGGVLDPWREHLTALAAHQQVSVKLSGMVTEGGDGWTVDALRPYAEHVLGAFGADRVMAGSDWPSACSRRRTGRSSTRTGPSSPVCRRTSGPPSSAAPPPRSTGSPLGRRAGVVTDLLDGRRPVGPRGLPLPRLGLGTAPLGNLYRAVEDGTARAVLDTAWDLGVRHFDTAPHYGLGLAERRLGAALASRPRDEVVVSTKVGRLLRPNPHPTGSDMAHVFDVPDDLHRVRDYSADGVRRSLEESLERLGLDRVDVVYVHDPDDHLDQAIAEAVPALAALRDEGVVGAVGAGMNQWQAWTASSARATSTSSCWPAAGPCSTKRPPAARDVRRARGRRRGRGAVQLRDPRDRHPARRRALRLRARRPAAGRPRPRAGRARRGARHPSAPRRRAAPRAPSVRRRRRRRRATPDHVRALVEGARADVPASFWAAADPTDPPDPTDPRPTARTGDPS